jgi:uridine phosphorylase
MGLRGGCAAGVIVNRTRSEAITKADLELGEGNAVKVAARAVQYLLEP